MSRRILAVVAGGVVLLAIAVVAFVADGATQSGSPSQQLRAWVGTTQVGQSIGTLQDDAQRVNEAVDQRQGSGVFHTLCAGLQTDAANANSNLPSPDTELTQILARAYGLSYSAGHNCYLAGAANDDLQRRSADERTSASHLFVQALARIQDVTGLSVSTTTTTQPPEESPFG